MYRCLSIQSGSKRLARVWGCPEGDCRYIFVPTLIMERVSNEVDCDERLIEDPPQDECHMETVEYNPTPLMSGDEWREGPLGFLIPYLTYDQAAQYRQLDDEGVGLANALDEVIGNQVIPERRFDVEVSASAPVATHDDLTDMDCVDIPRPANPSMP